MQWLREKWDEMGHGVKWDTWWFFFCAEAIFVAHNPEKFFPVDVWQKLLCLVVYDKNCSRQKKITRYIILPRVPFHPASSVIAALHIDNNTGALKRKLVFVDSVSGRKIQNPVESDRVEWLNHLWILKIACLSHFTRSHARLYGPVTHR